MNKTKSSQFFLFFCLIAFTLLVLYIISPFLTPLIIAAVLAVMFYPIHLKLMFLLKGRSSLSAFLVTILSIIVVILPVLFLAKMILIEATDIYKSLSTNNVVEMAENTIMNLSIFSPALKTMELDFGNYISQGLGWLINNIGSVFSSFAKIILDFFVFLIAFYTFLKDGKKLSEYLIKLSPLKDRDDLLIMNRLNLAIHGTIGGNLIIAVIQGMLAGLGFFIFGVPNPVLWGSIAAFAAVLPGIGTALVLTPAIIYLFVINNVYGGIGLTIWGLTAVGLIDNLLAPSLISRGTKLPPLAVFVSVLGGVVVLGPLGFIFGPLVISICFALVDIYVATLNAKK